MVYKRLVQTEVRWTKASLGKSKSTEKIDGVLDRSLPINKPANVNSHLSGDCEPRGKKRQYT